MRHNSFYNNLFRIVQNKLPRGQRKIHRICFRCIPLFEYEFLHFSLSSLSPLSAAFSSIPAVFFPIFYQSPAIFWRSRFLEEGIEFLSFSIYLKTKSIDSEVLPIPQFPLKERPLSLHFFVFPDSAELLQSCSCNSGSFFSLFTKFFC